jgi:hypothetical protein
MSTIDYSSKYAKEHKAYIKFASKKGGNAIQFLAFLNSLSIEMAVDRAVKENKRNDLKITRDIGVSFKYNFAFDIPFRTREESIEGSKKIRTLESLCRPDSVRRTNEYVASGVKILFANLINNGSGTTSIKKHGISCLIQDISIEYNTDFGFFDDQGSFHPKLYTININADVLFTVPKEKEICRGFNSKGNYDRKDVKKWPFALEARSANRNQFANSFERKYDIDHNAKISFTHYSLKKNVSFISYIDNFSLSNAYEFGDIKLGTALKTPKQIKDVSYKFTLNVPADSRQQANENMINAQRLFRILCPERVGRTISPPVILGFSNLIKNEPVYINSLSIKVDVEQGFFDQDGLFYIKNYTMDFDATKVIKAKPEGTTGGGGSKGDEGSSPEQVEAERDVKKKETPEQKKDPAVEEEVSIDLGGTGEEKQPSAIGGANDNQGTPDAEFLNDF